MINAFKGEYYFYCYLSSHYFFLDFKQYYCLQLLYPCEFLNSGFETIFY